MSSTTVSAQQSQTREHRLAAGLIELADLIYAGHIPEPTIPEHALRVSVSVADADTVVTFAERHGLTIDVGAGASGDIHTYTDLPVGQGSRPDDGYSETYRAAVVVHVYNIAPTEAV